MKELAAAVTFLTRIPLLVRGEWSLLARAVVWFPVIGAGIGLLVAAVYAVALEITPPLLAATLAVTVGIIVTGALHEDGLADTVDAFASSHTRERRLEILGDPRVGTFGSLALILSVMARITALAALDGWSAAAVLPAAHALARAAAVVLLTITPPARAEGMGAVARPSMRRGLATFTIGAAIAGLLLFAWAIPAALLAGLTIWAVRHWSLRKIGGSTGDVAGATEQLTEIVVLIAAAALVTSSEIDLTWWAP